MISACSLPAIPHSYFQVQFCKADSIVSIMQMKQERHNKVTCLSQGQGIGKGPRWYFKTQLYLLFNMLTSVEHLYHYSKHSTNSDAILYLFSMHQAFICLIVLPISFHLRPHLSWEVGGVISIYRLELWVLVTLNFISPFSRWAAPNHCRTPISIFLDRILHSHSPILLRPLAEMKWGFVENFKLIKCWESQLWHSRAGWLGVNHCPVWAIITSSQVHEAMTTWDGKVFCKVRRTLNK